MISFPNTIYLDYSATTPVDPRVVETMLPYFSEHFGNPASQSHSYGSYASQQVESARKTIANLLGSKPGEIVFTSGATESNNLVFKGIVESSKCKGNHIITTAYEHQSVLASASYLEKKGFKITYLPLQKNGCVDPQSLKDAITEDTSLVSIMFVNNEIGTINPIAELGKICHKYQVLFHCDAVQGFGKLPFNVDKMNVDFVSVTAHKTYGPKGIGALYIRDKDGSHILHPCIEGGGQEQGIRAGTLNVPGIVGFSKASELAHQEMFEESERLLKLREKMRTRIFKELPEVFLNGDLENRLPNHLNICFNYVLSTALLKHLPELAFSAGSACSSSNLSPSHVLQSIGVDPPKALSSVRITLGRFTTEDEVEYATERIIEKVKELRESSVLWKITRNYYFQT